MYLIKEYNKCPYYVYVEGMQYRAVIYKKGSNFDIPLETEIYQAAIAKVKAFINAE